MKYNPLEFCPKAQRARHAKRAEDAATKYKAGVVLKCIECAGWSYSEAKKCKINNCPLFALNRKVFKQAE